LHTAAAGRSATFKSERKRFDRRTSQYDPLRAFAPFCSEGSIGLTAVFRAAANEQPTPTSSGCLRRDHQRAASK
jgi:hypothetical protein